MTPFHVTDWLFPCSLSKSVLQAQKKVKIEEIAVKRKQGRNQREWSLQDPVGRW